MNKNATLIEFPDFSEVKMDEKNPKWNQAISRQIKNL